MDGSRLGDGGRTACSVKLLLAGVLGAAAIGAVPPAHVHAAGPSCPTTVNFPVALTQVAAKSATPAGGNAFIVCNGTVPTFDGTPLDIDVTLPSVPFVPAGSTTPAAKPPLVMLLSGWSNDICQFESITLEGTGASGNTLAANCANGYVGDGAGYHWNNAWFASNGWVTLTYTPRGWYESCGKHASQNNYSYLTDPTCTTPKVGSPTDPAGEKSWTHLYDRRYEIHDAQYLAGLIVDAGLVDANKIVSTGDSGGGGPSWDLALSQDQIALTTNQNTMQTCMDPTLAGCHLPWTSPKGTAMHLAAAVPMYTWTDLVSALLDNGLSSDGFHGAPPIGNSKTPIGVEKQSDVSGLYALGANNPGPPPRPGEGAQYVAPNVDPTADLQTWFNEITAGEPYGANLQAVADLIGGQLHSSFAMPIPDTAHEKPVFAIQGMTDTLFSALQALDMINRLKAADAAYPVYAFLGDIGHAEAFNKLDVWTQAHNESNAWLNAVIAGQTPTQPTITVDTTRCSNGTGQTVAGQTLVTYTANSFGDIATQQLAFSSPAAQLTTSSTALTYEGQGTDPVLVGNNCPNLSASTAAQLDPNQATYTFVVPSASTLVGGPVVHVMVALNGTSAELAARLWDVDANGNQALITRNVYRFEQAAGTTASTPVAFELWPNAWQLQCGHVIKLELTQNDAPTWRPDNLPSSMSLSGMQLSLPVVPGVACTPGVVMAEFPLTPAIPLVAVAAAGGVAIARRRRSAAPGGMRPR